MSLLLVIALTLNFILHFLFLLIASLDHYLVIVSTVDTKLGVHVSCNEIGAKLKVCLELLPLFLFCL